MKDGDNYHYCDPNAGVYRFGGAELAAFFDQVERCYQRFFAKPAGSDPDDPEFVLDVASVVELIAIYPVRPKGP